MDEIDFWVEADQILSDVESSLQARGGVIPEIANQMASEKECQASVSGIEDDCVVECQDSVSAEDDSTLENLDSISMSVSDVHSTALNQGISLFDPVTSEPEEPWKKTQNGDQPTNSALSKLSVDEAMSDLIRDTVSSGSVVIHGRTNHEQPEIDGAEWSFPCLQNLIDQYNSEKLQLESISGKHVQMLSEFMASYRRLRLLHEKTSHLRKTLLETEKEMVCCEAETLKFGASCREVAGEMAESQKRMQETADKLGKEVEVFKQNEFVGLKRRRT
jgi:endonuclease VIII-like 3